VQGRDCTAFLQWALPRLERSWPGYRRVRRLVCKRLAQRLKALGLADLDAYRRHLAARPQEWREFDGLCGIPVSRFYRDRGIYDALERSILPELVHAAAPRSALAAWSAGCASGEEPYTLALIWAIRLHPRFPGAGLCIVATDSNAEVLARARAGCYAASSLKELPRDLRTQGFEEQDGTWRIRDRFRTVDIMQQDLREAMPKGPFDLILCRNVVLTYYSPPLRDMLMARVVDRLRPGGALVIGAHESVPPSMREVVAWPGTRSIYRRQPVDHSA
jgi:chemotaxis protein methyltransferase CheR